jgi:hypothetical protein
VTPHITSPPHTLHFHSTVNSQILQHNNAGDLYTYVTFLIAQYPKVPVDHFPHVQILSSSRLKQACSQGLGEGGGANGCNALTYQSGCTHKEFAEYQRQTCLSTHHKKSTTPYHIHILPLLNRRGWKQLVFKNVCICKMFCAML